MKYHRAEFIVIVDKLFLGVLALEELRIGKAR